MTVTVERADGVVTAVMDDAKANALTFEVITGLRSALALAVDERAPFVIAGRSGYFSAGFDLRVMRSGDRDRITSLANEGFALFRDLYTAPIPVLAACTGHALAAGALLLLAADYRFGPHGEYQIGLNETRIGIALPQPAVAMARFRLSTNALVGATVFATVVGPEAACDVGYLDRTVTDPRLEAHTSAVEIGAVDLRVFDTTKQRVNAEILGQLNEGPAHHAP
jgi:enoyl-CoA hydratase